jgi:signal peptidase I
MHELADSIAPEIAGTPSARIGGAFGVLRPAVEFLVILLLGIFFVRTFAAEAYIVPTGSMAPVLLGQHYDYDCPSCHFRFALGIDEQGRSGRAACPNCGRVQWKETPLTEGAGDRLLVQKYLFDLRPPRRWETAVFQNPAEPDQAYVKRVVALPGEAVLIQGGDVYIDGVAARKTLEEQRALSIPIYDTAFPPNDSARFPRFVARRGSRHRNLPSGWLFEGTTFRRNPIADFPDLVDWLEYRHWETDRGGYGPVRDYLAYNGLDLPGENRVDDVRVDARIAVEPDVKAVVVRIEHGADHFLVTIPTDDVTPIEVRRNGQFLPIGETRKRMDAAFFHRPKVVRLEASVIDHRLTVALDDVLAFDPLDFDRPKAGPASGSSPVAVGVIGKGAAMIAHIRLSRDVYYTDALANAPRRPFGVEVPYVLGKDEYFVLGDNSPVSNDSRFWAESPVVRRELFIGKPFLVHLPSQAVPLRVFGRELYWIPDPREIRYIR